MAQKRYTGSKYSFENPEVWVPTPEENAQKEIPLLVDLFKKFGKVKNVLDVGCGMGSHAYLLSKEGYVCEGVEPHPKMIKYAQQYYPGVIYKVSGMQDINYKNKFDAVVCIGSIIVFNKSNEEVMKTFGNFYNALKKNGILILETLNNIGWIVNSSFRKDFEDTDKEKNERVVYHEWVNTNNQSFVSERTYYDLSTGKKKGSFTKESRMFFPLELKFFLEQAGFSILTMLSGDDTSKITLKDATLDKRRILIVARKK
ncbi:MAG: class I SAM-dependent methyltransferase [Nanoarchaeota archaeon]|nr:class I SAM-dependent methyltransferase [Nanoarchaeota archaeon]